MVQVSVVKNSRATEEGAIILTGKTNNASQSSDVSGPRTLCRVSELGKEENRRG